MILRLGAVLAVAVPVPEFARLLLLVALIRLRVTRLLLVPLIGLGLLLLRHEAGLLAKAGEILAFVVAVLRDPIVSAARLLRRLVLAELLLGRGDQPEIMFSVLVVIFGGDGIAG